MSNESVPFSHWIFLGVVVALVWILGAEVAGSAEVGETGFITENTHLCHTDSIVPQTISGLAQWSALIDRLQAAGGVTFLSEEDNQLGANLSRYCSTLAEGYPVVLLEVKGQFAIAIFDPSLGFGPGPFIILLTDFHAGGLEL